MKVDENRSDSIKRYSGRYTSKEKLWLTILRYVSFLLLVAGIYGLVTEKISLLLSVLALVFAVVFITVYVRIIQLGVERLKAIKKQKTRYQRVKELY